MILMQWILSIYKIFKHQAVCLHKLLFYLAAVKAIIDLFTWVQQTTCDPFYDPSMYTLIRRSMSAIFQAFMVTVVIAISYVLQSANFSRASLYI